MRPNRENEFGGQSTHGTGETCISRTHSLQPTDSDRFASVTWGRPLGINNKDCNIDMPADIIENPEFKESKDVENNNRMCFSAYQRELNKLYMIASPIIEDVYGSRTRKGPGNEDVDTGLAHTVTQQLWTWRWQLPPTLLLDLDNDCSTDMSMSAKVHQLQSLALQLTFDNLLIILHRPFLAQQVDFLQGVQRVPPTTESDAQQPAARDYYAYPSRYASTPGSSPNSQVSSPLQWWHAAVRISRVTELPQLAQVATETHLVAFLAINLFNSAIVMVVHALPDPLSDKAQEAKRTITRIFRLQELLGKRSTLSMQSSTVLRSVIHLLLRREAEAILAPAAMQNSADRNTNAFTGQSTMETPTAREAVGPIDSTAFGSMNVVPSLEYPSASRGSQLNESLASVQRGTNSVVDKRRLPQIADTRLQSLLQAGPTTIAIGIDLLLTTSGTLMRWTPGSRLIIVATNH